MFFKISCGGVNLAIGKGVVNLLGIYNREKGFKVLALDVTQ